MRDQQFKMVISLEERNRILKVSQLKGVSQADVMRMAFRDFEKKVEKEVVGRGKKPVQELETAAVA